MVLKAATGERIKKKLPDIGVEVRLIFILEFFSIHFFQRFNPEAYWNSSLQDEWLDWLERQLRLFDIPKNKVLLVIDCFSGVIIIAIVN